ncbi:MoaD/ThiS family protein [Clostridium bovifaecis]|uniref:MoaD/ThiS family protein n=1 Tax=Clostridium bovifaecis TaxID=2184719 RepID=A0A6I6FAF6_9CLOT|nr:MoaD/ThiS family protein [Clostridium bovifaecis]
MKIEVRLFAYFRNGRWKRQSMEFKDRSTLADIIKEIGIKEEELSIGLINGRDGSLDREVKDGDVLALFPPVGGG